MKKLTILTIVAGLLILAGCGTKNVGTEMTDEEAIREMILSDEGGWFNMVDPLADSLLEDSSGYFTLEGDTFNFVRAWGRQVLDRHINIDIVISGDTANVTINLDVSGLLHIAGPDTVISKPFDDHGTRYLVFVKRGDPNHFRGWVLDKLSMMELHPDSYTVRIDSVRIRSNSVDTVVADPTLLWDREDVLTFAPGETVEVALYTNNPLEILAYLHFKDGLGRHRRSPRFFYRPSDGALVGHWRTPLVPGVHRAAADILHWGTLYVTDNPYDSESWLFTYRVVP